MAGNSSSCLDDGCARANSSEQLRKFWQKIVGQISALKEELGSVSKSLSAFPVLDWRDAMGIPYRNDPSKVSEREEEFTGKLRAFESSKLQHLSREDLISFFRSEMHKLMRQHDVELHRWTEEIFRLKRTILRDRGSVLLDDDVSNARLEFVRRKLPEIISQMEEIIQEADFPSVSNGCSAEIRQIGQLNSELEDVRFESKLKDQILETVLRGLSEKLTSSQLTQQHDREQTETKKLTTKETCMVTGIHNSDEVRKLSGAIKEMRVRWLDSSLIETMHSKISKSFSDLETELTESIRMANDRIRSIGHRCDSLVERTRKLKERERRYIQVLGLRCSDLQKAEAEVDLLGDEVDSLLCVLGDIHRVLERYSPFLCHFPEIVEMSNLIKREITMRNG